MIFPVSVVAGLAAMAGLADAANTAGCGKNPIQSGVHRVQVNGKNREYTLKVPSGYNNQKAHRLVFGYHWLNGDMNNVVQGGYYGLDSLSQGSAIFVAPNGLNKGWANNGGEDIAFTDAILKNINDNLCVDDKQIFATGFSFGGGMSFSVACARPNVFRAVAPIAGAQLSGCDGGNTPIAYLGIHGVADSVLPVDRGRSLRDRFLKLNGCANKNAPEPSRGSGTHIKTEYQCSGKPVWWIAHSGDHVPDPKDSNGQAWAPAETWNFFTKTAQAGGVADTPQNGTPNTDAPQTGAPQTGAPQTGAPQTGAPQTGAPQTGAPQTGAPQTGKPNTGKPSCGRK